MEADVSEVTNALANQHPFKEASFMRTVVVVEFFVMVDDEFVVGMKFLVFGKLGVDYWVYESETMIFYAKCTPYSIGCNWLIRVSMIRKNCTCTRATISQDHSKLDSNTIAEVMNLLVEADPSIKIKSVIAEVRSKFNYTISFYKAQLVKQKLVKIFLEFEAMCHKKLSATVHFETMPIYQDDDLVTDIQMSKKMGLTCIKKNKGCLLVVVSHNNNNNNNNNNIVPITFVIVVEETSDA
ncbi:hypothetical protein Ahy_A02g007772 [Arachis hypogaea]|uniref:Transposase MuDR plant domain-containing protein n=1 Tax=Arachis hypogaea TaxID=3818 RepID=A0A445EDT7_ARAHY|nr:hypothetical protein Ahy_A02g007772 [Arachis hypogaea]